MKRKRGRRIRPIRARGNSPTVQDLQRMARDLEKAHQAIGKGWAQVKRVKQQYGRFAPSSRVEEYIDDALFGWDIGALEDAIAQIRSDLGEL